MAVKYQAEASRELDALIAEKVFGAPAPRDANAFTEAGYWTAEDKQFVHCRHYSTDIAAAWEVVEKLKGQSCVLKYREDTQGWECSFIVGGKRYTSMRSIITHAICVAALRAVIHD